MSVRTLSKQIQKRLRHALEALLLPMTDVPAFQAQTQVDPSVAHLEALLASARVGLDVLGLVKLSALSHAVKVASQEAEAGLGPKSDTVRRLLDMRPVARYISG